MNTPECTKGYLKFKTFSLGSSAPRRSWAYATICKIEQIAISAPLNE